jgi:rare lipoprotein A
MLAGDAIRAAQELGRRCACGMTAASIIAAVALAGCAQRQTSARAATDAHPPPPHAAALPLAAPPRSPVVPATPGTVAPMSRIARGGGTYKIGQPYQIAGRWYTPAADPTYDRVGVASWYGRDFHGKKTANGELFDVGALTAAHPTLPLPSFVFVTNLRNGRTLLLRVNDRGPYIEGRMIDLSLGAARLLGYEGQGTTPVRVRYAGPAPLDGNEARERDWLARQPWSAYAAAPAGTGPWAARLRLAR